MSNAFDAEFLAAHAAIENGADVSSLPVADVVEPVADTETVTVADTAPIVKRGRGRPALPPEVKAERIAARKEAAKAKYQALRASRPALPRGRKPKYNWQDIKVNGEVVLDARTFLLSPDHIGEYTWSVKVKEGKIVFRRSK